jgi:RNA polymerase sigma-70 factor (ECF subfamily)
MREREPSLTRLKQEVSFEDTEDDALQRLHLRAALGKLDQRSQEIIALRYGADLSDRQIGDLLEMKPGAVRVAMHRAFGKLRAVMEADEAAASMLRLRNARASSFGGEVSSP